MKQLICLYCSLSALIILIIDALIFGFVDINVNKGLFFIAVILELAAFFSCEV